MQPALNDQMHTGAKHDDVVGVEHAGVKTGTKTRVAHRRIRRLYHSIVDIPLDRALTVHNAAATLPALRPFPMQRLVPIDGSTLPRYRESGLRRSQPDPSLILEATVLLDPSATDAALAAAVAALAQQRPHQRAYWSADKCARFGARREHVRAVAAYARDRGLLVQSSQAASCSINVSGTVAAFTRAFDVHFARFENADGNTLSYDGPVSVPRHLRGMVVGILGLDTRALSERHAPLASALTFEPTTPEAVAKGYRFPDGTGRRQTIGVIELGGGFDPADVRHYFRRLRRRAPAISVVAVAGGGNNPRRPRGRSRGASTRGSGARATSGVP